MKFLLCDSLAEFSSDPERPADCGLQLDFHVRRDMWHTFARSPEFSQFTLTTCDEIYRFAPQFFKNNNTCINAFKTTVCNDNKWETNRVETSFVGGKRILCETPVDMQLKLSSDSETMAVLTILRYSRRGLTIDVCYTSIDSVMYVFIVGKMRAWNQPERQAAQLLKLFGATPGDIVDVPSKSDIVLFTERAPILNKVYPSLDDQCYLARHAYQVAVDCAANVELFLTEKKTKNKGDG